MDGGLPTPDEITRRDFLDGAAIGVAGLAVAAAAPSMTGAQAAMAESAAIRSASRPPVLPAGYYPPRVTGGKGHDDSFVRQILKIDGMPNPNDVHSARGGRGVRVGRISPRIEHYDCVIVGGGASGLAAAKFYQDRFGEDSRILILEALPDFGGHAVRNEFHVSGSDGTDVRILRNGGTFNIDSPGQWGQAAGPLLDIPGAYGQPARDLLDYLGVDPSNFPETVNSSIPSSLGLRNTLLFGREEFGSDRVVQNRVSATEPDTEAGWRAFLARTPYDAAAVEAIVRIQTGTEDVLGAVHGALTREQKIDKLTRLTYRQYLVDYFGATDQALLQYQRSSHSLLGAGAQAVSAADMWLLGEPGFAGLDLGDPTDASFPGIGRTPQMAVRSTVGDSPYWPDGNASLLRLLLSRLIPGAVPDIAGARPTTETVVNAVADYGALDCPANPVRLRLSSLVVKVRPAVRSRGGLADVLYVPTGGESGRQTAYLVRASHVVMACWNRVTAQIVEGLPRRQVKGLTYARKVPLIYGRAALRNWQAFADAKISSISPRGNSIFWDNVSLAAGASFGTSYGPNPNDPDSPAALNFTVVPSDPGTTPQLAAYERGREILLGRSFTDLEADLIDLLDRTVNASGGDFDPGRDLASIMINRWNYGYAHELTSVWDPTAYGPDAENPHVKGRVPFRNIAIANSDSGAFAYTHSAFSEGYRAVWDLPEPSGVRPGDRH